MKQKSKQIMDVIVTTLLDVVKLIMPNTCLFRMFPRPHKCGSKGKTLYVLIQGILLMFISNYTFYSKYCSHLQKQVLEYYYNTKVVFFCIPAKKSKKSI